jgi:hypothetical protein
VLFVAIVIKTVNNSIITETRVYEVGQEPLEVIATTREYSNNPTINEAD